MTAKDTPSSRLRGVLAAMERLDESELREVHDRVRYLLYGLEHRQGDDGSATALSRRHPPLRVHRSNDPRVR